MAEDCLALLDHLSLEKVSVLGHSLGGYIAQRLALRWPERVNRLILVGTTAATSKTATVRQARFLASQPQESKEEQDDKHEPTDTSSTGLGLS